MGKINHVALQGRAEAVIENLGHVGETKFQANVFDDKRLQEIMLFEYDEYGWEAKFGGYEHVQAKCAALEGEVSRVK